MTDNDLADEGMFPIRELSARTQVNTVTIRAWERRYGLLKPKRTAKGHRLYSEQDVINIEKIIALTARGVPLGKVKALLSDDLVETPQPDDTDTWQESITDLFTAVINFSASKVEHHISELFASYPAPVCRERLIEPLFSKLSLRDDDAAALTFAESELLRYTSMRLNAKVSGKHRTAVLMAGKQAPIWQLALMALELRDAEFSVYLFNRSMTVASALELSRRFNKHYSVFYQDGLWNEIEQTLVASEFSENDRLFLCGTAPSLSHLNTDASRVFPDVKACISGLLKV